MTKNNKKKLLLSLTLSATIMVQSLGICLANDTPNNTLNNQKIIETRIENKKVITPQVVKNAPKLALKIDRKDIYQLPRNFRTGNDKFQGITKDGIIPSRKGMENMNASASSTFSEQEFKAILDTVPVEPNKFYDIDLRGESHGYLNGTSVSWFADHNWGNDGRTQSLIEDIEKEQLEQVKKESPVKIYQFDDNKNVLLSPIIMNVDNVRTEENMVEEHGANYFRLALSDHFRPDDSDVDKFINFYKQLPEDAWLHYHCYAGMGRTTIFMVMHDILKNAKNVSFKDIIQRQKLIGIVDLSEIPDTKKNWGRKAYIERYQFVKHFYDYVKSNPTLSKSWSSWAKEHDYETYSPDYSGYIWRLDAENSDKMPNNFRTVKDCYKKSDLKYNLEENYIPSRVGLDDLDISGSPQFSVNQFNNLVNYLKKETTGPIYIIDLRQESHGFFNNEQAVSWYGKHDWANLNKNSEQILKDEQKLLKKAKNNNVIIGQIKSDKTISVKEEKIDSVMTESDLVKRAGLNYVRITATDHIWPDDKYIDQFIELYKTLPQDAWLHFHCEAGVGRTTTFMTIYDMMKNPNIPLKDILYRQHLIGGNYVAFDPINEKNKNWKNDYYHQKAKMIKKFYEYIQKNHENNYETLWSEWIRYNK